MLAALYITVMTGDVDSSDGFAVLLPSCSYGRISRRTIPMYNDLYRTLQSRNRWSCAAANPGHVDTVRVIISKGNSN